MKNLLMHRMAMAGLAIASMLGFSTLQPAGAAGISEPETVIYGKVLTRSGPQTHLLTEGLLTWKIRTPDGGDIALESQLQPLKGGEFSYRLSVPQQAVSFGLALDPEAIALSNEPQQHEHLTILIDQSPARILAPGSHTFGVDHTTRAGTLRVDLEVDIEMPDSDGDGLPDWWEDAHGFDKQVADADGDADGDGLTNLAEFLGGSNPHSDSRHPSLAPAEVIAYAEGRSGILLRATDSDSAPSELTFRITAAPPVGALTLRNATADPENPDAILAAGSTFTQADIDRGRLVFVHSSGGPDQSTPTVPFSVSVRDEVGSHPEATAEISIMLYRPENMDQFEDDHTPEESLAMALSTGLLPSVPMEEELRVRSYMLSRAGDYIVWEFPHSLGDYEFSAPSSGMDERAYQDEFVAQFGRDQRQIVIGGAGNDHISGGMESDILAGGRGDDQLRGGGGADRFVILDPGDGNDTIVDFNTSEGDSLDLSRVLHGTSTLLSDYVRVRDVAGSTLLELDLDGDGSGFDDLTIDLQGDGIAENDLHGLWANGHLLSNGLRLPPVVGVERIALARENGPVEGAFQISRVGLLDEALEVQFQLGGSAANGTDYSAVSPLVTIPAGENSVDVVISPFVDGLVEGDEIVELILTASSAYQLGSADRSSLAIRDLVPEITIEALQPLALRESGQAGIFLVRRTAAIDRSAFVGLQFSGTAVNGVDFTEVPPFLNLLPGQTSAMIEIVPSGVLAGTGAERWATVSLADDPAYLGGDSTSARVVIADRELGLGHWREEHFPDSSEPLAAFSNRDPGGLGLPILIRYAFGLDPQLPVGPDSRRRLPSVDVRDGQVIISFPMQFSATDIDYIVEQSDDLQSWVSGPEHVEEIPSKVPGWVAFRSRSSQDGNRSTFLRVRVQR